MAVLLRFAAIVLTTVFLLSIVTAEPDYVQGYRARGLPVLVEKDAAYAVCDAPTLSCDYFLWVTPLCRTKPVAPSLSNHIISTFYRGPPLLSFSL